MSTIEISAGPLDDEVVSDIIDYLTDKIDASDTLEDDRNLLRLITQLRDNTRDLVYELEDRIEGQEEEEQQGEDEDFGVHADSEDSDEDSDEDEESDDDQW